MLSDEYKQLLAEAEQASQKAYAPYSGYHVGAAVLAEHGTFTGANIENASSNLGICAERVALANAHIHGKGKILAIAVYCRNATHDPSGHILNPTETMPCGGCRQWLAELAPQATLLTNASDTLYTVQELLPMPFSIRNLSPD